MANIVLIASLGFILFFALDLVLMMTVFRQRQDRSFSLLNQLPFELAEGTGSEFRPFHQLLITGASVLWISYIFGYIRGGYQTYYVISLITAWVITGLVIFALFIFDFRMIKRHLLLVTLLFLTTMINSAMSGIYVLTSPYINVSPVCGYILLIPGALALVLAFNPKLKNWPIMDKNVRQDGVIEIMRPKKFSLAYTEWGLIGLNVILLLINSLIYLL